MGSLDVRALKAMVALEDHPLAKELSGLVGSEREESLRATVVQAEALLEHKDFNPREHRGWHGRWSHGGGGGGGVAAPTAKVTADSHPHPARPDYTPEQVAKMAPGEADRYARHAKQHVDSLMFQRDHRHGGGMVSKEQIASAQAWAQKIQDAADAAHSRKKP